MPAERPQNLDRNLRPKAVADAVDLRCIDAARARLAAPEGRRRVRLGGKRQASTGD